jgi:ribosomal protein L37AE/L43A
MSNRLGCGGPLKLSSRQCEFCGTEFADIDGGATGCWNCIACGCKSCGSHKGKHSPVR